MAHPTESVVAGVFNPTQIWFHGDAQAAPQWLGSLYAKMRTEAADALACATCGDLVSNGTDAEYTAVLAQVDPYFDRTWAGGPIFIDALGNHEVIDGDGLTNYRAAFTGQRTSSPQPFLDVEYGVDQIGVVRLIRLDTTSAYTAAQRAFVQCEVLTALHFGLWPVVLSHHDAYSCCDYDSSVDAPKLLPLIQEAEDAGCRLWLCGHTHRYKRTVPMKLGAPAAGGIVYVCLGRGTIETAQPAAPTKTDSLDGSPNIARVDNYDAAQILAKLEDSDPLKPRPISLLTATPSTLLWQTWTCFATNPPVFTEFDMFTLTR